MIENSKKTIPVLVSGALGRMGSEVINAVLNSTDCELVAAIDINDKNNGSNISELLKVKNCDIFVSNDFEGTLCSVSQNYRSNEYICISYIFFKIFKITVIPKFLYKIAAKVYTYWPIYLIY